MVWIWVRLLCGTWEPVASMLREKFKWRSHENESTDARHRGGSSCISDEVSVMEMERRGWVSSKKDPANQKLGGANFFLRRPEIVRSQEKGWQEPCESRGSCTDLWGRGCEIPLRYPTLQFQWFFDFYKKFFDMRYFLKSFMGILLICGWNSFAANPCLMLWVRGKYENQNDQAA